MYKNIKKFMKEEDALRLLRANNYIIRIENEDSFTIQNTFIGYADEYSIDRLYFIIYQLTCEIIKETIIEYLWDIDSEDRECSIVEMTIDIIDNKEYGEFLEFISKIL